MVAPVSPDLQANNIGVYALLVTLAKTVGKVTTDPFILDIFLYRYINYHGEVIFEDSRCNIIELILQEGVQWTAKCRCVTNATPDYERILTSKCRPLI